MNNKINNIINSILVMKEMNCYRKILNVNVRFYYILEYKSMEEV